MAVEEFDEAAATPFVPGREPDVDRVGEHMLDLRLVPDVAENGIDPEVVEPRRDRPQRDGLAGVGLENLPHDFHAACIDGRREPQLVRGILGGEVALAVKLLARPFGVELESARSARCRAPATSPSRSGRSRPHRARRGHSRLDRGPLSPSRPCP